MKKLLTITLCVMAALCGCKSTLYKTTGIIVVTADRATDGWLNYYVRAKRMPGADTAKLASQNQEVAAAYSKYQSAMDVVDRARLAADATTLEAARTIAASASTALVNLVLKFLPPYEAAQLKATP